MNEPNDDLELALEAERYELFADPTYNFSFDRRQFLKAFSGGIALIVPATNLIARRDCQTHGRECLPLRHVPADRQRCRDCLRHGEGGEQVN
ncbi:MAG TPA: hypothetical protein VJ656_09670, partial [Pyrinomonadaceae bacterium]|nr:hypothetical protein [Pyrinomonadaceae bacterium]